MTFWAINSAARRPATRLAWAIVVMSLLARPPAIRASAAQYHSQIQPILAKYCSDCHADGADKGGVAFDAFKSDAELFAQKELWWTAVRYIRAGIMPPAKKNDRPTAEERETLARWVKSDIFGTDPKNPDPGRVTLRRLNRVEYRNTIHDLMGIDFNTDEEFPPDDSGYGFDNIGDVLTLSPLLLEKYMHAAETIVAQAVPKVAKTMRERTVEGAAFRSGDNEIKGERMSFYKEGRVSAPVTVDQAGKYRVEFEVEVDGQFDFDPGQCKAGFFVEEKQEQEVELAWRDHKRFTYGFDEDWKPGERRLAVELHPLTPPEKKRNSLDLRIIAARIKGPFDPKDWKPTKNYDRFFFKPEAPAGAEEQRAYAREILARFAAKAFRRPANPEIVDRLAGLAAQVREQPGKTFEESVAQSMAAVLASPRFLFRVEQAEPGNPPALFPRIDEYSLASRLSYFLWSTMPDEELTGLASRGELRGNLGAQVKRLLADSRSQALVRNFTGQWLELRDVEGTPINERAIFRQEDKPRRITLEDDLRRAMRRETEMVFNAVVHDDRPVLELLDSDYTFLNEKLAKLYEIPDVKGDEMRRVTLPTNSVRGGILTDASTLLVTSNPTRTSPVKRGLFILDNVLGTPAPPPPPNIPNLEDSKKAFQDHTPTLRETLEFHRAKPLCASCHNRMDPLGLALENFNALGQWRPTEHAQPINPAGTLISGESFQNIGELKKILVSRHAGDFYRCLAEKLLTYAIGRGLEYYDTESVDIIVDRLEKNDGRFSSLLLGVVDSAPFQRRRAAASTTEGPSARPAAKVAQSKAR